MADKVEDLTANFTDENGVLLSRELEKTVLTKGGWATLMFMFQDLDSKSGQYKAPKMAIRRYQKKNGEYRQQSKFNFSSAAQARQVAKILLEWADKAEKLGDAGGGDDGE